jgi:hypothetical protein
VEGPKPLWKKSSKALAGEGRLNAQVMIMA